MISSYYYSNTEPIQKDFLKINSKQFMHSLICTHYWNHFSIRFPWKLASLAVAWSPWWCSVFLLSGQQTGSSAHRTRWLNHKQQCTLSELHKKKFICFSSLWFLDINDGGQLLEATHFNFMDVKPFLHMECLYMSFFPLKIVRNKCNDTIKTLKDIQCYQNC